MHILFVIIHKKRTPRNCPGALCRRSTLNASCIRSRANLRFVRRRAVRKYRIFRPKIGGCGNSAILGARLLRCPFGRNAIRLRGSGYCAREAQYACAAPAIARPGRAGNTPSLFVCRGLPARQSGCAIAPKNNAKHMFCCIKFKK